MTEKIEKIELLKILSEMKTVEKVSNFPRGIEINTELQGRFFLCPKLKGKGYQVNCNKTGFTVRYDQEGKQRKSAFERIGRVKLFLNEFRELKIPFKWEIKGIVASAEAKLLFPEPVDPPLVPPEIEGFPTISTYELLERTEIVRFWELYRNQPWLGLPREIIDLTFPHIAGVLSHTHADKNLIDNFVRRVFTEYALEGIWFSEGKFGKAPIILGVENPEDPIIMNTVLPKEKQIPVIQLK